MRNIRLTIEYDGKDFNGWQKQPNKLNIQGEIERAIELITGEENIDLIGVNRLIEEKYPNKIIENSLENTNLNVKVNIIVDGSSLVKDSL